MKKNILPYIWKHSRLVYNCPKNVDKNSLIMNAEEYIFFENKIDFAYVAIYNDHVVISFKGTDNIKGWISNIDPYPLKSDEYNNKYLKDGRWGRGSIHDGFYTSWKFFKSCINKVIEAYHINPKELNIITCGHSRGGALAELCARHLAKNLGMECSCITFGAPAVGTKRYRDQFRMLTINGTRVVNGWDLVPDLPPSSFGFKHGCANKVWMKKALWKRCIPWIRINDNYQNSYELAVNKRFLKK